MSDQEDNTSNQVNSDTDANQEKDNNSAWRVEFNKAMSAREKQFEKKLVPLQEENKRLLQLMERFAPQKEEPKESRYVEMERSIQTLSKKLQDAETEKKNLHLRSATEKALKSHGIQSDYLELALGHLIDSKKAVKFDASGELVFSTNDGQTLDLETGLAEWSQTKEAKLFKPMPPQVKGSASANVSAQLDKMNKSGNLELTYKDKISPKSNQSQLDRSSQMALNELLKRKFFNQ